MGSVGARGKGGGGWPVYVAVAVAVVLAWQILKAPVAVRAPPALALRAAPTSPDALRRAAEAEFAGGRLENALELAQDSLRRAPFNARALRVRGLVAARQGDTTRANDMLTLAGNWSLRDDPTHAWLIEQRLRQGDYGSAMAHADTLVRRRVDLYPRVFTLFTTAITQDRNALPPLGRTLANNPPWRSDYIAHLLNREDGAPALLMLGATLERSDSPLNQEELLRIYQTWNSERRLLAIRYMQRQTGRPAPSSLLQDGDFSRADDERLPPLDWQLGSGPGLFVDISEPDDTADDLALNVDYDGYGSAAPATQLLFLDPGSYRLTGRQIVQVGRRDALRWEITCVEDGAVIARQAASGPEEEWTTFTMTIAVPQANCVAQRLTLQPNPGDRRETTITSYDKLVLEAQ